MKSKGLRISDQVNSVIATKLTDILCEIQHPNSLSWAILFSDVMPLQNEGKFINEIERQINNSKELYEISWDDLISFAKKIYQEIDLIIIGCRKMGLLKKYNNDE